MNQDLEIQVIIQAIAEKIIDLLKNIQQQPEKFSRFIEQFIELSIDFLNLSPILFNNSHQIQQMQFAYWQDTLGLWQEQLNQWNKGTVTPVNDKRFSNKEWMNHPFFNLLSKHYLLAKEHINSLFEHLNYGDEQLAKRIQFFIRQYLDALSPDNFLHTNPHIMAETIQSHGKNLLLGLQNFLSDIDTGSSRLIVSMTDKHAFKIGENIAITPGKVIYKNELMELIQYIPQTPKVKSIPLLIIPPWINKYYILDLSPDNSLIRWVVEQGITVFVISWANPNATYANKGISNYLDEGPIEAIKAIQTQLQVKQVNALGFCIGGTLLAMLLAYNKAKNINTIRSATFLASMIDFSDPGDISVFIDENQISKLEKHMNTQGYLEGQFMSAAFNSLRASDLIWAFFIRNYLHGKPPIPFDLLFWNSDTTNMPAKMHSQYLRWMYLYNDLVKPGKIQINNTPLDISNVDIPTFFVSTIKDHIAPWKTTYLGFQLMKGKKRFLLGGSGHIAGIVIPPGKDKYGYYVNQAKPKSADSWLRKSHHRDGSWWPEWLEWLKMRSGRLINAPVFNQLPMQAIENAPGSYVFNHVPSSSGPG